MFANSNHTQINDSHLLEVRGDYISVNNSRNNVTYAMSSGKVGIERLHEHIAAGAFHNAEERYDAPRCQPETREAVQRDIMNWADHPLSSEDRERLLWMRGAAGAGKSAIMQEVSERCSKTGRLAASFFFSHQSPTRNNHHRFVATLAYQIAMNLEGTREYISAAVERDMSVFQLSAQSQLEMLVVKPVQKVMKVYPSYVNAWPKSIFVDGLDECEGEVHQSTVLNVLRRAVTISALPFRVVLASRPERAIREFFDSDGEPFTRCINLDQDYDASGDIDLYLRASFNTIRSNYKLASDWPSEDVLATLVDNASGQFVYASTVIKFISDRTCQPREHLKLVLAVQVKRSDTQPFAPLDALYTTVFNRCIEPKRSALTLQMIHRAPYRSSSNLNFFLELKAEDHTRIFEHLHSLVYVPAYDAQGNSYHIHHKSCIDFLNDQSRSRDLHTPENNIWQCLATQYLRVVKEYESTGDKAALSFLLADTKSVVRTVSKGKIEALAFMLSHLDTFGDPLRTELRQYNVNWWADYVLHRMKERSELHSVHGKIHASLCINRYRCDPICRRWENGIFRQYWKAGYKPSSKYKTKMISTWLSIRGTSDGDFGLPCFLRFSSLKWDQTPAVSDSGGRNVSNPRVRKKR